MFDVLACKTSVIGVMTVEVASTVNGCMRAILGGVVTTSYYSESQCNTHNIKIRTNENTYIIKIETRQLQAPQSFYGFAANI